MQLLARKWEFGEMKNEVKHCNAWLGAIGVYKDLIPMIPIDGSCPYEFWLMAQRCGAPESICDLGRRLGKSRAASADMERLWNTLSHVYGS